MHTHAARATGHSAAWRHHSCRPALLSLTYSLSTLLDRSQGRAVAASDSDPDPTLTPILTQPLKPLTLTISAVPTHRVPPGFEHSVAWRGPFRRPDRGAPAAASSARPPARRPCAAARAGRTAAGGSCRSSQSSVVDRSLDVAVGSGPASGPGHASLWAQLGIAVHFCAVCKQDVHSWDGNPPATDSAVVGPGYDAFSLPPGSWASK